MNVQSLEIISVNIWQIVISLCNLLIMFLIVKKFLFKPVKKIVAERQAQVDSIYADADASKTAAETMKAEYETRLASAKEEADTRIREAVQTAQRKSDGILADAASQAAHIKQKAEAEISLEKKRMLADVRSEIGDMAVSIAGKIVEREISADDHRQLVDDFIRNVGEQD